MTAQQKITQYEYNRKGDIMEETRKEIVANFGEVTLEEELVIILRDNENLQRDIKVGKRAERYLKDNKKRMFEIMAKLMEV